MVARRADGVEVHHNGVETGNSQHVREHLRRCLLESPTEAGDRVDRRKPPLRLVRVHERQADRRPQVHVAPMKRAQQLAPELHVLEVGRIGRLGYGELLCDLETDGGGDIALVGECDHRTVAVTGGMHGVLRPSVEVDGGLDAIAARGEVGKLAGIAEAVFRRERQQFVWPPAFDVARVERSAEEGQHATDGIAGWPVC